MVYSVNFNGTTLFQPGAYTRVTSEQNLAAQNSTLGIVAVIGEASGGAPGATEGPVVFSAANLQGLVSYYRSGPLVNAARILVAPGSDTDIPGGAQFIVCYKTNSSSQATGVVTNLDTAAPATLLDLTSANYGLPENQISFSNIEGTQLDEDAKLVSKVLTFPLTVTTSGTMILTIRGTAFTFTSPALASQPIAAVLAALNDSANWAPSKPIIAYDATDTGGSRIGMIVDNTNALFNSAVERLEYNVMYVSGGTTAATQLGFRSQIALASDGTSGGTFTVASLGELALGSVVGLLDDNTAQLFPLTVTGISGTGPYTVTVNDGATNLSAFTTAQNAVVYDSYDKIDLDTLVVTEGPSGFTRGVRGSRIVTVKNLGNSVTLPENQNSVLFRILYTGTGTVATMTIQDSGSVKKLTTAVTGDSASNLDIQLSDYPTVAGLVDYINNFNGGVYVCVTDYFNAESTSSLVLDYYNAIDIRTMPLGVKGALNELTTIINSAGTFLTASQVSNVYGQLEVVSGSTPIYLAGATSGGSSNASFQLGFDKLIGVRANTVVPLICQDATADIAAGLTNPASTYTVSSIIAQTVAHCALASNTKNRSERNGYVSFKGTYAASKAMINNVNSAYVSFSIQDILTTDGLGNAVWLDPQYFATCVAGMQNGSPIGTPMTHKVMNVLGLRHADFDPAFQADDAIQAGILFGRQNQGWMIEVGNTTYKKDQNPVFNRIGMFETVNYICYDSRLQLEPQFIGKSTIQGASLVQAYQSSLASVMNGYKDQLLLFPTPANDNLGYKILSVVVDGLTVKANVLLTIAPEVDFLLNEFVLGVIQDSLVAS